MNEELKARNHLLLCAIGERSLRISRGIRSIPIEWSLSDLREKTDDDLLRLPAVGNATLSFIREFLSGELQEKSWKAIERQLEIYSKTYPNVFIHVHHETVPEGCTSWYEKAFDELYPHPQEEVSDE